MRVRILHLKEIDDIETAISFIELEDTECITDIKIQEIREELIAIISITDMAF